MTRDEAIVKVWYRGCDRTDAVHLVQQLEALGLLQLEPDDDTAFKEAAEQLSGARVPWYGGSVISLNSFAAAEIMDILRKSGFKITREGEC